MEVIYELLGFSETSGFQNGYQTLVVNWAELLHSAITIGRKNWDDVYHHQYYSEQEIHFRYYMVRAFFQCEKNQLEVSKAYKTLDPSEKGGINYFIGCIFTKKFAESLFETPWLMHLDVYKKNLYGSGKLNITYKGDDNSRPDFIGIDKSNNYSVFEAKGRVKFSNKALDKAYDQSKKLKTINGAFPKWKVGCVTYHDEINLRMKIKDPEEFDENAFHLKINLRDFYYDYYAAVFHFIIKGKYRIVTESEMQFYVTNDQCLPFTIGMEKELFELMRNRKNNRNDFLKRFNSTVLFSTDFKRMFKK